MTTRAHLSLFLFTLLSAVNSYIILVYNPKFGHSHSNILGAIADTLVEAGYNVASLISEIDPSIGDGTKVSNIIRVKQCAAVEAFGPMLDTVKKGMFFSSKYDLLGAHKGAQFLSGMLADQCRAVLEQPGLIDGLKEAHFDVMIAENFDMCGVGLSHLIGAKSLVLVLTTVPAGVQLDEFGIPLGHDRAPLPRDTSFLSSFSSRLYDLFDDFAARLSARPSRAKINTLFQERYSASFPSVAEICSHAAYVFTYTDPLIDYALPTLNKYWQQILDQWSQTVLISFGSLAKAIYLPEPVKTAFAELARSLPLVTFIWKYEAEDEFSREVSAKVENLVLTKWMPQVDLLAHEKVAAFITHGGMGSTQELALRGKPGIFAPLFGDQMRNARVMEYNGLGKVLDKADLAHKLIDTVREVLDNESYAIHARRISAMLQRRPFSAREQLVKYTEFAAEFGASSALRPASHDMSWIAYHNVDIILIVLVIAGILIVSVFRFVTRRMQTIVGRRGDLSKKNE